MIKRIIAILLCVVVLGSFSLSAFASVNTREYENVNSIMDSFISSFLSYCGVEVEFFNWDIDYSGSEFKNAAWFNLVRNFTQYIENNDAKLSTKISEYASSSGVTSSINSSSYVWTGNFKDCRSIVNFLVSHLYNFLDTYWVKKDFGNGIEYGSWGDIPLNLYIADDYYSGGFYTRVTFSNAYALTDWYSSVGLEIQDLCEGNHVADDFAGCVFSYRWDYNYLPIVTMYPGENTLSRVFYLDYLNLYISNYEDSPGGGSGDSSGDSSDSSDDTSSGGTSSDDTSSDFDDNFDSNIISFSKSYYRSLFLGLLSTYNIDFYAYDEGSGVFNSSYFTSIYVTSLVDYLYSLVSGDISSWYIDYYYPDMYNDFLRICQTEYDNGNFGNLVYSFYPFSESVSYRRFVLGFFELFKWEVLDSSLCVDSDDGYKLFYLKNKIIALDMPSDFDSYSHDYVEYSVCSYTTIHSIPVHKDTSLYFGLFFDGYDFCHQYSDIFNFDSQELFDFGGYNIRHLTHKVIYLESAPSSILNMVSSFLDGAGGVFDFVRSCLDSLPSIVYYCFLGGFLVVFAFVLFRLII